MKAKLYFDLTVEEDRESFDAATTNKAASLKAAVHAFKEEVLRKYRKYGGIEHTLTLEGDFDSATFAVAVVDAIETEFYEILERYGVDLE